MVQKIFEAKIIFKPECPWAQGVAHLRMTDQEWNHMWNFGRVHHEEQFCEIILNLGQWFRCCLKISYLVLWQSSCLVKQNHLCNFERGHHGEHSCEVKWNLDRWFRRRCPLKKKFMDRGTDRQTKTSPAKFRSTNWRCSRTVLEHLELF